MTFTFTLPWPPSVNTYYRAIRRGRGAVNILSAKGRQYPQLCKVAIGFHGHRPISGRIRLLVDLYPPDRRRRDLDNHIKPLQDALTKCRIWEDDSQVDELKITRKDRVPGGQAVVTVEEV